MWAKYNHQESEIKWQKFWEDNQIYAFSKDSNKPIYSIDTPPPTVSGKIHIGHIFSYTQAEVIARYKRMMWYNVFYPMGYDNNGIPTEQLVEKDLGINIKDVERKDFVQKCLEVVEKYKVLYENLWRSMWFSIDRSKTYTTISPNVQQIAQQTFVKLFKEWHIVYKDFPALRCTKMQTTVAQAETEEKEFNEFFNYLNFTLEDGEKLVIATTRPELLPACLAVFVHPDDERFAKYVGKKITTPLGIVVPVLADDKVKMDKWTGAVMCCSYGDEVDVFWIKKHNLWEKIVINRYGKMQDCGVPEIEGMKIEEAREKIMQLFEERGLVVKRDPITQSKQISERGKVPVEILPVKQRFVNLLDKKEILLKKNDEMNRYPAFMKKRSNDRIENLQRDRNISRSRKFWIPIPVWYDVSTGKTILPSEAQLAKGPIDPTVDVPDGFSADQVQAETLVLDTRFTSWLTPLINQTNLKKDWYTQNILPMNLRPQAHDIIRTWLLYTTLQTYFRDGQKPFDDVMMSGFCMAVKGEKFSKSKWNAKFDPEHIIAQWSADAVRFRACGGQLGKDILFDETEFKNGQKLVTKLRNAFQFVKMQLADADIKSLMKEWVKDIYPTDQWILIRLNETIAEMKKSLDKYEYGAAKIKFDEFFWKDFCDMYLEMIKVRLYQPERFENGEAKKASGQWALYVVFDAIIKLIAPYLPHITEEIYQDYFKELEGAPSIHITSYPEAIENSEITKQDPEKLKENFIKIVDIVETARKFKTEKQISMGAELQKLILSGPKEYLDMIATYMDDVSGVTKAMNVEFLEKDGISTLIENE